MESKPVNPDAGNHSLAQQIVSQLDRPEELENMYQSNAGAFRHAFYTAFPEISDNIVARVWNERLSYKSTSAPWILKSDLIAMLIMVVMAGIVARIPRAFDLQEATFYQKNISFILIPLLIGFFIWKKKPSIARAVLTSAILSGTILFINLLPETTNGDILFLSCLHMPLFLWFWTGFSFSGNLWRETETRMQFIRFNGDWLVMTAILGITAGLITAITVGLFDLIDINLEIFIQDYAIYWLIPSVPLMAGVLVASPQNMVSRIAPVVARIITPLVIVILFAYLIAMMISGTSPFTNRENLIIFNVVLIGVMALISFSFIGTANHGLSDSHRTQLIVLSVLALVVNAVALSAISFRIAEWGMTPNRLAVLGSNALIMSHLVIVTTTLLKSLRKKETSQDFPGSIVRFLPVYMIWMAIVTFLFPVFSALAPHF